MQESLQHQELLINNMIEMARSLLIKGKFIVLFFSFNKTGYKKNILAFLNKFEM